MRVVTDWEQRETVHIITKMEDCNFTGSKVSVAVTPPVPMDNTFTGGSEGWDGAWWLPADWFAKYREVSP
jgi:hypothetical protein